MPTFNFTKQLHFGTDDDACQKIGSQKSMIEVTPCLFQNKKIKPTLIILKKMTPFTFRSNFPLSFKSLLRKLE